MNKTMKILLLFSMLLFSCSSSEIGNKQINNMVKKVNIKELAKNMYGKNYILSYNSSKDFVICMSNAKSKIPNNSVTKYFVFDMDKNVIVVEDKFRNGNISWYSNYEIKIVKLPGIVKKNQMQEYGYVLNVKTNLRTKINGGIN